MNDEIAIKDRYGRIIGYVKTEANGDKVVRNFAGQVQGYYHKSNDATTDFYGRTIAYGDASGMLLKDET